MLGVAVEHEIERSLRGQLLEHPLDGTDFHYGAVVAPPEIDLLVHAQGVGAGKPVGHSVGVGEGQNPGVDLAAERAGFRRIPGQVLDQAVHQIGGGRFGWMDTAVDPDPGLLRSGNRSIGNVQQLERSSFVTEADGVENHVWTGAPGFQAFLKVAICIWVI